MPARALTQVEAAEASAALSDSTPGQAVERPLGEGPNAHFGERDRGLRCRDHSGACHSSQTTVELSSSWLAHFTLMAFHVRLRLGGRESRPMSVGQSLPLLKRVLARWQPRPAQQLRGLGRAVRRGTKRLAVPPLPRALRLRVPDFALPATIGRGLGRGHNSREVVKTWWALHRLDVVLWSLAIALGVVIGLVAARG
jgi:hypothetical protein